MKTKQKKQERGAIIVEIIAVIALLGVMGPLLFKQVSDRNEEVENINLASQMRVIKEALSSYIISYHSEIEASCNNTTGTCSPANMNDKIVSEFLPFGYDEIFDKFNIHILSDTNELGTTALQGYIIPDLHNLDLPDDLPLRRVARIANLIGADGGIYMKGDNEIHGTGGAWHLDNIDTLGINDEEHTFVATTGMDTFKPSIEVEDFDPSNIMLPDNLGLGRLHAWDYFSVGSTRNGIGSCFELKHNTVATSGGVTTAQNDVIYEAGGTNDCSPLFWVGSSSNTAIPAGDVFVKQQLHLRPNPQAHSSIVLSAGSNTTDARDNPERKISVFNTAGTEMITIDATGKIVAVSSATEKPSTTDRTTNSGDAEKLTIQNGRIDTNIIARNAANATGESELAYSLDPRYTSIMNDIRLESRGGARLSDLLPTYILKTVEKIDAPGNTETAKEVVIPSCPQYHYPAIMVTPVSWHQSGEKEIVDAVIENVQVAGTDLTAKTTTTLSNNPILPQVKITRKNSTATHSLGYIRNEDLNSNGSWEVFLTYSQDNALVTDDLGTPIVAIVHTYCIFDRNNTTLVNPVLDRPNTQK